jgi:hypothetical protein
MISDRNIFVKKKRLRASTEEVRALEVMRAESSTGQSKKIIKITASDNTGELESLLDKEDEAMHAIISSYNVGMICNSSGLHLSGKQIVLWLKDLKNFDIQFDLPEGVACPPEAEECVVVKCAMESVLRYLLSKNCIKKNNVILQIRPRGEYSGPIIGIILNPEEGFSAPFTCRTGIVEHTNAYLDEGMMVISLDTNLTHTR